MKIVLALLAGMTLGVWLMIGIQAFGSIDEPECVIAPAILDGRVQFGEIVVCGEMITSRIHGPDLRSYTGPIEFYHDHEEE